MPSLGHGCQGASVRAVGSEKITRGKIIKCLLYRADCSFRAHRLGGLFRPISPKRWGTKLETLVEVHRREGTSVGCANDENEQKRVSFCVEIFGEIRNAHPSKKISLQFQCSPLGSILTRRLRGAASERLFFCRDDLQESRRARGVTFTA